MRHISQRFDEFKDKEYADWRRIRLAVEHENTLVNHRITWLLTSQAFLIAALVGIFNEAQKPEGINADQAWLFSFAIALISITICFAIGRSLAEASFQLDHLDKWWYRRWNTNKDWMSWQEREEATKCSLERHPEIQGRRSQNVFRPKVPLRPDGIPVWPFTFGTVVFFLQILWGTMIICSATKLIPPAIAFFGRVQHDNRLIRNSMAASDLALLYSRDQQKSTAGSMDAVERAMIRIEKKNGIIFANQERVRLYRDFAKKDALYELSLAIALSDLSISLAERKMWDGSLSAACEAYGIIDREVGVRSRLAGDLAAVMNNIGVIYREKGDSIKSRQFLERSKALYFHLLRKDPGYRTDFQAVLNNIKRKPRP
jgi:hypothetical protein